MLNHCRFFSQLFLPRTGSHYTRSLLESHPDVSKFAFESGNDGGPGTNDLIKLGVDTLRMRHHPTKLVGLRTNGVLLVDYNRYYLLEDKVIMNYRMNKLEQYISLILAWEHKFIYQQYEKKISINIDSALKIIDKWLKIEEIIRSRIDAYWIEYNEVLEGNVLQDVLKYLGLSHFPLTSDLPKQSTRPHLDYVVNLDEVINSSLSSWLR